MIVYPDVTLGFIDCHECTHNRTNKINMKVDENKTRLLFATTMDNVFKVRHSNSRWITGIRCYSTTIATIASQSEISRFAPGRSPAVDKTKTNNNYCDTITFCKDDTLTM